MLFFFSQTSVHFLFLYSTLRCIFFLKSAYFPHFILCLLSFSMPLFFYFLMTHLVYKSLLEKIRTLSSVLSFLYLQITRSHFSTFLSLFMPCAKCFSAFVPFSAYKSPFPAQVQTSSPSISSFSLSLFW